MWILIVLAAAKQVPTTFKPTLLDIPEMYCKHAVQVIIMLSLQLSTQRPLVEAERRIADLQMRRKKLESSLWLPKDQQKMLQRRVLSRYPPVNVHTLVARASH